MERAFELRFLVLIALGLGVPLPSSLWLMQQSSGNLADSIGTCTFNLGAGLPMYQQWVYAPNSTTVVGWSRKAVVPRSSTSDYFGAWGVDISTTSAMFLLVIRLNAAPAGNAGIMSLSNGVEMNGIEINSQGLIVARNKANSTTGAVAKRTGQSFSLLRLTEVFPGWLCIMMGVRCLSRVGRRRYPVVSSSTLETSRIPAGP